MCDYSDTKIDEKEDVTVCPCCGQDISEFECDCAHQLCDKCGDEE